MNKILYYTVEKTVSEDGFSLDGFKNVSVYEIIENVPKMFFSLDIELNETTKDEINAYLSDNGYGDEEFTLVLL